MSCFTLFYVLMIDGSVIRCSSAYHLSSHIMQSADHEDTASDTVLTAGQDSLDDDQNRGATEQDCENASETGTPMSNWSTEENRMEEADASVVSIRTDAASNTSSGSFDQAAYTVSGLVDNWRTYPRNVSGSVSSRSMSHRDRNSQSVSLSSTTRHFPFDETHVPSEHHPPFHTSTVMKVCFETPGLLTEEW